MDVVLREATHADLDTWSPIEVVGHLLHAERQLWIPRALRIVHGERGFAAFDRFAHLQRLPDVSRQSGSSQGSGRGTLPQVILPCAPRDAHIRRFTSRNQYMPTSPHARRPTRTAQTVQARAVAVMLDRAAAEGMDRVALVEAAGLRQVDLDDPDSRVPLSAQVALWRLIAKGNADPGLGVRWGASVRVRELGLLGYAVSYSATLGAALRRVAQYRRALGDAAASKLEASSDPRRVAVVEYDVALGAELPCWTDFRLAVLVSVCREITGVEIVPIEVAFAHDQPASTLEHRRFFRCPLRFGQPASSVVLPAHDLELPVPRGDETLAGYLSDRAERELRSLLAGASTKHRVRSAIWAALSEGRATLAHIASALELPPRTLQRRLAEEGTSLHSEIEDVRKAMAVATLRDRSIPIEDVAFILGYAEPSTFFRSFKRWTGTTPHRYRSERGGAGPL